MIKSIQCMSIAFLFSFVITPIYADEYAIPAWIKTNAEWWANDQIDDDTFVSGIQFLVANEIIVVDNVKQPSNVGSDSEIPKWIKDNARWWAENSITEQDFVNGIRHLINNGILTIPSNQDSPYIEKPDQFEGEFAEMRMAMQEVLDQIHNDPVLDAVAKGGLQQIPFAGPILAELYENSKGTIEEKNEYIVTILTEYQEMNDQKLQNTIDTLTEIEQLNIKQIDLLEVLASDLSTVLDYLADISGNLEDAESQRNEIMKLIKEIKEENQSTNVTDIDTSNSTKSNHASKTSKQVTDDMVQFKHYMTIPDPGLSGSPSDIGQFNQPLDLAVDSKGNIYVSDYINNRIQKFDPDGTFLDTWGGTGDGIGQFRGVGGIFIDDNDVIYVGEYTGTRIQIFDENGKYLKTFPPENTNNKPYTLSHPHKVAIDSENFIYVADQYNSRIVKLNSEGQFVKSWGSSGSGTNEFEFPTGIAIDSNDFVYVTDQGNHRIMKFDNNGNFVDTWGAQGYGYKQFTNPTGIAIDEHDIIYVAEYGGHRISILNTDGTWLGSISSFDNRGNKSGQFIEPFGVAVNGDKVYTVEYGNSRVQVFTR